MVEPTPDVVGIPRGSVALRRFVRHRPAVVATGVLGIIVVFVVIGPLFVPFSPPRCGFIRVPAVAILAAPIGHGRCRA